VKTLPLRWLSSFVLLAYLGTGFWAYAEEDTTVLNVESQRAAIEEARHSQTQLLDAMARNCERKFAVTRCLEQVRAERLEIERGLKRQETLLNDAQRLARGREQKERNREKATAYAERMADLTNAASSQAKQPKQIPRPRDPNTQPRPPAGPKTPVLTAQARDAHVKAYQRKQADANTKRAEVAKRVQDAGAKKPSLPRPE
jgi:colicin import membrane protein